MPIVKDPKTGKKKKLPYPGQPGFSPDLPGMPPKFKPKKKKGKGNTDNLKGPPMKNPSLRGRIEPAKKKGGKK